MTISRISSETTNQDRSLIITFTFLAFILGTVEYIIVGLLSEVSESLQVTLSQAGYLVSGFAVAFAAGTPFALLAVSRISKRRAILICMIAVTVLCIGSAAAGSYASFMIFRMLTAVGCGLAVTLAISIASDSVAPERRGQAIAYIMGGFSIANVLGVPIGTFVGQFVQWRAAFLLTAGLGVMSFILMYVCVPRNLPAIQSSLSNQFKLLTNARVVLAFLIPISGVSAIFALYTYITPVMVQVMNIPERSVSLVLFVYGAFTIISNYIGARVATGNYVVKLRIVLIIQLIVFLLFGLTAQLPVAGWISLMGIASLSFTISAAAQLYLIELAEAFVPKAKDFAASLMPIGANIGIAVGSSLGASVVARYGFEYLPILSAVLVAAACVISVVSHRMSANCLANQKQRHR